MNEKAHANRLIASAFARTQERRQWLRTAVPGALLPGLMGLAAAPLQAAVRPRSGSAQEAGAPQPHASLKAGEPLRFPHDHGAHPLTRTEWWYLTGEIELSGTDQQPLGFQITFFRSRVDQAQGNASRFAPRQLLLAHAALSDAQRGRLLHDQRIARVGFGLVEATQGDTGLTLRDWTLVRQGPTDQGRYSSQIPARDFLLDLQMRQTQPPLLQGQDGMGLSRKSPSAAHATRYYSMPHLALQGRINYRQQASTVQGHAWLDHEWGETILSPDTVGWDWIGMNLRGGGALMVFRTRRRDGSVVWHGGSLRRPGQPDRIFESGEIRMTPGASWQSPASGATYPVHWTLALQSEGVFTVRARMPNQELDGLYSSGSIYWEGLCDLLDAQGRVLGSGYLEMTGYATPMAL